MPFPFLPNAKPRNLKFRIANTLTVRLFSRLTVSFSLSSRYFVLLSKSLSDARLLFARSTMSSAYLIHGTSDFQKTVMCRFDSCLKKTVFGVVKDYYKELKKNQAEAIPFCELPDIIIDKVAIWDTYKTDYTTFNICGHDIYVYDDELAKVIKQLSDRYRENVLMYYFLDMSDTEIAKLQNISRSGVFQNRHYALKQMKKSLEEGN